MALIRAQSSSGGGGGVTTYDYNGIKSIVESHSGESGYHTFTGSKATVNEGATWVDTVNHIAFMYADFTITTTATPSNYDRIITISGVGMITPDTSGGAKQNLTIIAETTATNSPVFPLVPYNGATLVAATKKYTTGERNKIYAAWTTSSIA